MQPPDRSEAGVISNSKAATINHVSLESNQPLLLLYVVRCNSITYLSLMRLEIESGYSCINHCNCMAA
jgi:hypothetical protein